MLVTIIVFAKDCCITRTGGVVKGVANDGCGISGVIITIHTSSSTRAVRSTTNCACNMRFRGKTSGVRATMASVRGRVNISAVRIGRCSSIRSRTRTLVSKSYSTVVCGDTCADLVRRAMSNCDRGTGMLCAFGVHIRLGLKGGSAVTASSDVVGRPFAICVDNVSICNSMSRADQDSIGVVTIIGPRARRVLLMAAPHSCCIPVPKVSKKRESGLARTKVCKVSTSVEALNRLCRASVGCCTELGFASVVSVMSALKKVSMCSRCRFAADRSSRRMVSMRGKCGRFGNRRTLTFYERERGIPNKSGREKGSRRTIVATVLGGYLSPAVLLGTGTVVRRIDGSVRAGVSRRRVGTLVGCRLDGGPT